jgi:lipopolysaccharide/colanic/teichoic acid biosynthesis glycosyltransferase
MFQHVSDAHRHHDSLLPVQREIRQAGAQAVGLRARIQYDIDTMRNGSLLFDLMIIGKTLAVVWRDQNAY